MLCPKCKTLLCIQKTYQRVEGDASPDTPTKVFTVQELMCRNKKCENFEKIVHTVQTMIYASE